MENKNENVVRKPRYSQVCIWPGTTLGDHTPEDFEKNLLERLKTRTQFLEIIYTKPDINPHTGECVTGTGGRPDLFFAVHEEDVMGFAIPRLGMGIRWVEDALSEVNGYDSNPIYPERVKGYMSWVTPDPTTPDENTKRTV